MQALDALQGQNTAPWHARRMPSHDENPVRQAQQNGGVFPEDTVRISNDAKTLALHRNTEAAPDAQAEAGVAAAAGAEPSEGDQTIQNLREQIRELQEQLQEARQRLIQAQAGEKAEDTGSGPDTGAEPDTAAMRKAVDTLTHGAEVETIRAEIEMLSQQLLMLNNQLKEAMQGGA